jgi:hypothetical protein
VGAGEAVGLSSINRVVIFSAEERLSPFITPAACDGMPSFRTAPRTRGAMAPAFDACVGLCDDLARAVHPDFALLDAHAEGVKTTADAMLARLDELGAMLGTLRAEGREQGEALEPVLGAFAEGLARDFAYVDSVEDTIAAIELAVSQTEKELTQLEQSSFRDARAQDVESARKGISDLFTRLSGVTSSFQSAGSSLVGEFGQRIATGTTSTSEQIVSAARTASVSATGAVALAKQKMESKKKGKEETNAKLETDSYWEESGDSPPTKHAHNNSVVNTLSDSVGKVTEGLIGFVAGRKGETEDEGDDAAAKGNIPV